MTRRHMWVEFVGSLLCTERGEAWRGKTKLFWSPGTIWPPCDKGEIAFGCVAALIVGDGHNSVNEISP